MAKYPIQQPLASIIVVNWNGQHLLKECIDSLLAQTYPNLEILLVDNGSTDDSVTFLQTTYPTTPTLRILQLPANIGFSGGNNAGAKLAHGEFLLLINNDAIAEPEWATELITAAIQHPNAAGFSSKIMLTRLPGHFENTGLLLYPDGSARGRAHASCDTGQYDTISEIAAPSGCACLYRRDMFERVGGFTEDFFCYCEDTELGLKHRLLGYTNLYIPTAIVHHKESATAGKYSRLKAYLVERNRITVMLTTYPFHAIIASPYHTAKRLSTYALAFSQKRGSVGKFAKGDSVIILAWLIIKAYLANIIKLPQILRTRRHLRRSATSTQTLTPWLYKHRLSTKEFTETQ